MLRTNSKKLREKVKAYIVEDYQSICNEENYNLKPTNDLNYICAVIYESFLKWANPRLIEKYGEFDQFSTWLDGIPEFLTNLDNWYINDVAHDIVKEWLEETEAEAERFGGSDSYELIKRLFYREIKEEIEKGK